ncbi:hypothetical protein GCM10010429_06100 [Micromonospora olivasterospora]
MTGNTFAASTQADRWVNRGCNRSQARVLTIAPQIPRTSAGRSGSLGNGALGRRLRTGIGK